MLDEEEEDDDEAIKAQRLLELLEGRGDDEGGMAIEYLSGEEDGGCKPSGTGKGGKSMGNGALSNGADGGLVDEDDDMMGDEY
jgi:hypothetical protein